MPLPQGQGHDHFRNGWHGIAPYIHPVFGESFHRAISSPCSSHVTKPIESIVILRDNTPMKCKRNSDGRAIDHHSLQVMRQQAIK
ncbi:hypothetical protein E0E54_20845, partial [Azotobacter chroococcum]